MAGRYVRLRDLLLGMQGLALLRGLIDGDDDEMSARMDEIRTIVADLDGDLYASGLHVSELDPRSGYAASSETYDTTANPLIAAEQPVVEQILAGLVPGRALDAACGTGRYAKLLAERHDVTGFDASPEMLAVARRSVPQGRFVRSEFDRLPFSDGHFDLVVCALALCHLRDLTHGVGELARVSRRGAKLVFTDPHPMSVAIISHLFVPAGDGKMGFVRNHMRLVGDYLNAFDRAGLRVIRCIEPLAGDDAVAGLVSRFFPEAGRQALVGLPFAIVWELEVE